MWKGGDGVDLRPVESDHLDAIVDYLRRPELIGVRGIEHDRDRPMSRTELAAAIESFPKPEHGEVFGVWSGEELVGHTRADWWWDVHTPSLDVIVDPDHRRRGVATAAARMMLHHLFQDTPARLVDTWIPEWNEAGIAFAGSLGCTQVGTVRRAAVRQGRYVDAIVMYLPRHVWEVAPWR